ncbi:MAG: hypothetical protein KL863_20220 [Rhizobium sp.]|nr:hypothetical protein [Rhizobium sp.]
MTTFSYSGYLSTHDLDGDATAIRASSLEVVVAKMSTPFSYTRPAGDNGILLASPIMELRIDQQTVATDDLDADIVQISWNGDGGEKLVANVLVVTLDAQRFTMQISGNTLPTFTTPAQYDDFVATLRSQQPLTFGFYGPGEKIPYDRIMTPGVTEDDVLLGTAGKDKYNGGIGDDSVSGQAGRDILKGGAGDDWLDGGIGADKLYGGKGADIFFFDSLQGSTVKASGRDIIVDFSRSQKDRIDVSAFDTDLTADGDQAFAFIGKKSFTGETAEIRYEKNNGDTFVFADLDADGKADLAMLLDGGISLRAGDFIL